MADKREQTPIIVVRRGHGEHDDHHGGAWKIAYADFMTAMMALFLVLWLVNASSDETKAAVASYFNPIELTDRTPRARGLADPAPRGGAAGSPGDPSQVSGEGASNRADEAGSSSNDEAEPDGSAPVDDVREDGPRSGSLGGEAYRDPFSLDYWSQAVGEVDLAAVVLVEEPVEASALAEEVAIAPPIDAEPASDMVPVETASIPELAISDEASNETVNDPLADSVTRALAKEVAAQIAGEGGSASVQVIALPGEVVIRLADDPERSMFAIGSSDPAPGLAADLARVAATLRDRPGAVAVHGHTDARAFQGDPDGNWRLSARRAEAARRLLLRSGLPRERVIEVVAHADRAPRPGLAPDASGNRRIELRLRVGGEGGR